MSFDPITWGAGFLLTTAAKKGLEVAFSKKLRSKLEDAIADWAKEVSKTSYILPTVLFSNISSETSKVRQRPYQNQLQNKLLDLTIPSEQDWYNSLFEQWNLIRDLYKENAQDFFKIDESVAKTHLHALSKSLYNTCIQDEKTTLPHIATRVDQIAVSLDELKYLSTIKSIPQDAELNAETYELISKVAMSLATENGMASGWLFHYNEEGRKSIWHVFGEDASSVKGVLEITEAQILAWASLKEPILKYALKGVMFENKLFSSVDENWNNLVDYVGRIAGFLYPNSYREGHYGISADYDLKRIGVPLPIDKDFDINSDDIKMLKLNKLSVPFLTFDESKLQELTAACEV